VSGDTGYGGNPPLILVAFRSGAGDVGWSRWREAGPWRG
jgi:hypothetical protein